MLKYCFTIFNLLLTMFAFAQHDGCDKCSMLREEYEGAVSPKKEELYKFFSEQCLTTQTVFVTAEGDKIDSSKAAAYQVVTKGKCIPYHEVRLFDKTSKRETASYKIDKDTIYTFGTKNPEYPGGAEAIVKYLSENLQYPSRTSQSPGTVYIKFVVQKNGALSDIKVQRSVNAAFDQEALRVIREMPSWIPGEYNTRPVNMSYILPVKFSLR
jgi:TonB family protein